jgi:hypothetical protein
VCVAWLCDTIQGTTYDTTNDDQVPKRNDRDTDIETMDDVRQSAVSDVKLDSSLASTHSWQGSCIDMTMGLHRTVSSYLDGMLISSCHDCERPWTRKQTARLL